MNMDNSDLINGELPIPKQKCGNCEHDIVIYKHVLSSVSLIFHDKNGIFSRSCGCGCKCPKAKDNKVQI